MLLQCPNNKLDLNNDLQKVPESTHSSLDSSLDSLEQKVLPKICFDRLNET